MPVAARQGPEPCHAWFDGAPPDRRRSHHRRLQHVRTGKALAGAAVASGRRGLRGVAFGSSEILALVLDAENVASDHFDMAHHGLQMLTGAHGVAEAALERG